MGLGICPIEGLGTCPTLIANEAGVAAVVDPRPRRGVYLDAVATRTADHARVRDPSPQRLRLGRP